MRKLQVLLADDHTLSVEASTTLLEPEFEVARSLTDGRPLLAPAPRLSPDVIVIDLGMPLLNGLRCRKI